MTIGALLGIILGVFSLIALLTGAYVVLRSTLAKTTGDLWKQEADVLRVRLDTVEELEAGCKNRLAVLESANQVLSDQVTGATAVALLSKQIERNQADIIALIGGQRSSDRL